MMRRETGNDKLISIYEAANGSKTPKEIFVTNMSRAIILFFTDPICALVGIYMAIC
jgi:high-affinity K+ transport system ATPase subunit B